MTAAASRNIAQASKARWNPPVSAAAGGAWAASRALVRAVAIAEKIASPSAVPSCWEVASRPAASPAWSARPRWKHPSRAPPPRTGRARSHPGHSSQSEQAAASCCQPYAQLAECNEPVGGAIHHSRGRQPLTNSSRQMSTSTGEIAWKRSMRKRRQKSEVPDHAFPARTAGTAKSHPGEWVYAIDPEYAPDGVNGAVPPKRSSLRGRSPTMARRAASTKPTRGTAHGRGEMRSPEVPDLQVPATNSWQSAWLAAAAASVSCSGR